VTSALAGLPLLILLVFAEGPPAIAGLLFTIGISGFAVFGAYEYFRALRLRGFEPSERLGYIAVVLIQFAVWTVSRGKGADLIPALLAFLVIIALTLRVFRHEPEPLANIGVSVLGVLYVGGLFSYLIFLRSIPGTIHLPVPFVTLPEMMRGAWIVLYVFAVTFSTDTGAYLIGRKWGKTLLAPEVSPAKTREGAIGGVVVGTLMSVAFGSWIGLPVLHCLVLGLVLSAVGQVGDLCESALKRDVGVKDFGSFLPGHGGILDRCDSVLFTAPVAYYYLIFFVVGSAS
jgi:phosphatidate cytidylyltransferase